MDKIKDVVSSVMEEWNTKKVGGGKDAPAYWLKKVLTKRELAHIKVNYFKKGILGVWVDSSGWLYALHLRKTDLLDKLREVTGDVKDIRIRIGAIK